jgi:hypothetical protein
VIAKLLATRWIAAIICAAAAVCLPTAVRLLTGPPGGLVHVRWGERVDAVTRQTLEARLRLLDGVQLDGTTWRYDLIDPSPDTIRALVEDPAVDDTHHIDRAHFVLDAAERTARRGRFPYGGTLVTIVDAVAMALASLGALLALAALWRTVSESDRWARERTLALRTEQRLIGAEDRLRPYALLATLGVAVYATSLRYPPSNGDDLTYLGVAGTLGNPLLYFFQNPAGGAGYRPLLEVGLWVVYQLFGAWAFPNQLINLVLHLVNVFLLYRIIHRAQPDTTIAWLFTAVFLVSNYSYMAATWVADRPMALVGLFLLLLVNHLSRPRDSADRPDAAFVRLSAVAVLSVLALLSKESGLVVPLAGLLFALLPGSVTRLPQRDRRGLAVVTTSIIGLYVVLRVLIFGSASAGYTQDGYMLLGLLRYEDSNDLPPLLRYLNYLENIVKHALAPVLPIFDVAGSLLGGRTLLVYLPVIVPTAILFGLAVTRHPPPHQWLAVAIILANAATHYLLFRHRLHYLSHAAFCLFVASSPLVERARGHQHRLLAAKVLAVVTLMGGIWWTNDMLTYQMAVRVSQLRELPTDGVEKYGPIVEEVLRTYGMSSR